jgi:hypothetical protein
VVNELQLPDRQLESGAVGYYKTNWALISLIRSRSFWVAENEPTVERLCLFAHEYAHYLHNFSTIAGLYDFIAQLRFDRLFIRTVDSSGQANGMLVLDETERAEFGTLMKWRRHLRGDIGFPFDETYHRRDVKIRVIAADRVQGVIELPRQQ